MLELLGENMLKIPLEKNPYDIRISTADNEAKPTPFSYHYRSKGIWIGVDKEYNITGVAFHNDEYEPKAELYQKMFTNYNSSSDPHKYTRFQGVLPFGLDFSLTQAQVRNKLGNPSKTDYERQITADFSMPNTDIFVKKNYKIIVTYRQYSKGTYSIESVTVSGK